MIVSRETQNRLKLYEDLVVKWNPAINLIAASTVAQFRERHVEDCVQLYDLASPRGGHWVDLGSGGGLPGIVISILSQGSMMKVSLVESDQRKSAFLRTVIRELELTGVSIFAERIESISHMGAHYISARAVAPLPLLLAMVDRHLTKNGNAWLMKGRNWRDECKAAREDWRFDLQSFPSKTDQEAAILNVTGVSHV